MSDVKDFAATADPTDNGSGSATASATATEPTTETEPAPSPPPPAPAPAPTAAVPAAAPALPAASPPLYTGPTGPIFGTQWPGPGREAPQPVLVAVLIAGVVAAASLPWDGVGIGWFVTALAVASAVAATVAAYRPAVAEPGNAVDRPGAAEPRSAVDIVVRISWAVATLALVAVSAVRAAPWLLALCLPTALITGAFAVAGGRTVRGLFLGVMSVPIAAVRALPWGWRTGSAMRSRTRGNGLRTALAAVIGLVLLLVFGALLAGADAAFARMLDDILPTVDAGAVSRWVFSFILVGLGTLAACFLALAPPAFDGEGIRRTGVRRIEWALPVGALVVLFAAFVAVQATVLFGGRDYVLRTAGLTAAEYARSGFWQLLVVTILTLVVLAVAAHLASRATVTDRIWLRALLGALAALTLVIVASALSRMWAYEQAYGFTRLRLLVAVCEIWLGVVFLLVMAAGVRLRGRATWLPGAVVGTAVVALLGIAVLNPDRYIAEQNAIRFADTGGVASGYIDLYYLRDLSADAVPALDRLPEPYRSCALDENFRELKDSEATEEWRYWNLGRAQARSILANFISPYDTGRGSGVCATIDWDTNP
jgi:Domain of unknown function (DUF4173)